MEVLIILGIIFFLCFIGWIANRHSGNDDSLSDDGNAAETTQYQNNYSGERETQFQQTQEVQPNKGSQPPLPSQWIHTDNNDKYYLAISLADGSYCGPITLTELRAFQLMPDYMVTTEELNWNWYPAGIFFCLADLFYENMPNMNPAEGEDFKVNDDGTITKLKKKKH